MSKRTSKYIRIYGMTLKEISEKLDLSIVTVHNLLNGQPKKRHQLTILKFKKLLKEGEL